ncbi:MAG: ABC transporter ATP-binding protein [Candidatus Krumholzibacteriia bacterium]
MKSVLHEIIAILRISRNQQSADKMRASDLRVLWPYVRSRWRVGLSASLTLIIVALLTLPIPYLMKYIVDDVLVQKNLSLFRVIMMCMIGLYITKLILSIGMNYLFVKFNQEVMMSMKCDLFKRLLKLPFSFFSQQQTGYLVSRLGEVSGIELFISGSFVRLLSSCLEFAFSISVLFYLEWRLTLIALCILPFYAVINIFFSSGIRSTSKDLFEKAAIVARNIQESFSGIDVIKTFANEDREAVKLRGNLSSFSRSTIVQSTMFSISQESLMFIGSVAAAAVLWYSGIGIMGGTITLGTYMAFLGYMGKLYAPVQMAATLGLAMQPSMAALKRIRELFQLAAEDEDPSRITTVSSLKGSIVFRNVSFGYREGEEVLHDISLCIKPGETVAICGPSGSGKSTIIRLILGLYKSNSGTITIDGFNIDNVVLKGLRERIGIVSQNIFLFNDTIRNNICYTSERAGVRGVIEASRVAGADEFITKLTQGYDTLVGERGIQLSGGQIQRLAIARAVLSNPDVLIFDEATCHLDSASEKEIRKDLNELFKGKTRIIITHHLKGTDEIERIYMLENGRIAGMYNGCGELQS